VGSWAKGVKVTSEAVIVRAFQSMRGSRLCISFGFASMVSETSSQSFGCKGNDVLVLLQAFTAQERKLRVRIFILLVRIRARGTIPVERWQIGNGRLTVLICVNCGIGEGLVLCCCRGSVFLWMRLRVGLIRLDFGD